ncbi:DNA alkylation repair protein [Mucilaginibacter calamicampi]|uniref:DNA alkylation repair protein n=1 Tax=Mucilaginibacter calamicampi TaxID=1302352 RepID=A0ABW2YVX7_9SPHI
MNASTVIEKLKEISSPVYREGMLRFGIENSKALGVKVPALRKLAKEIKKDHQLAQQLWETEIHEARLLATMIADPKQVTEKQFDKWVLDFETWDVCDQACGNLFDQTPFAIEKALDYSAREEEFVKRAGFVLMAELAVHDKKADDLVFIQFFPIIEREAWDERNFVKKAVNWALRQIGKRNNTLKPLAIATAERILQQNSKPAKWIANDALRELRNR